VQRHTEEGIEVMDMASRHPIIRLPVRIHSMVDHSMVLSLELVVVASHGVEAVAEYSVADEGSVVGGSNPWKDHAQERRPPFTTYWPSFRRISEMEQDDLNWGRIVL